MNIAQLQEKLMAAARANVPDKRVPYAFEKRVTALLAARAVPDPLAWWGHGLWRAAASCVAIALLLGAWILCNREPNPAGSDLSQNFENTLLASVDQGDQVQ